MVLSIVMCYVLYNNELLLTYFILIITIQVNVIKLTKGFMYEVSLISTTLFTLYIVYDISELYRQEINLNFYVGIAIFATLIISSIRLYEARFFIKNFILADMIGIRRLESKYRNVTAIFYDVLSIFVEEILFRYGPFLYIKNVYLYVFVSTICFIVFHHHSLWTDGKFSKKDTLYQALTGALLAFIFHQTESLMLCFFLHLTLNSSNIIIRIRNIFNHEV
jgi:hypothetical protein